MTLTRCVIFAVPVVLAVTLGASPPFSTASSASEADDFDFLRQLETDASGRTTVGGAVLNQIQEDTTQAFTGAMAIVSQSYDRQMRLQRAKSLLANCNHCPDEAGLKASYERQRANDDRIRDAVSYTLMKAGADRRIAGFLNMLLDPTGMHANEQILEENADRRGFAYCFVLSKADPIKQQACGKILSADYVKQKDIEGWDYCKQEAFDKFGITTPQYFHDTPNPSPAQVSWEKCRDVHQLSVRLNRLVADTCHIPVGIVEANPLAPPDLVKICNPNPDVPNLADARDMVRQGKIVKAVAGPDSEQQAYQLFKKAAELGDPDGMGLAGEAMVKGAGVAKDESNGMQLVQSGMAKGSVDARLAYAKFLLSGEGVPHDPALASRTLLEGVSTENALRQASGIPPKPQSGKEPPGPAQSDLEYLAATMMQAAKNDGMAAALMRESAKIAAVHPLWAEELGSKIKLDDKTRAALEVLASKRRREMAEWFLANGWGNDADRVYYNRDSYPVDATEVKEAIDEERLAHASLFVHGYQDRLWRSSPPNPAAVKKILANVQSDAKYIERAKAMIAETSAQQPK